jgi:hypothetical protein
MKLGRPADFGNARSVRIRAIERAIAQYQFSAQEIKKRFADRLDKHTVLFLKGLGNDVNLLSAFRDLFFNSRELLDYLLVQLNKITISTINQTPRDFLPFANRMMKGDFDEKGLKIIKFLKTNITYIFHIRKVRNEIKNDPSNIEFLFKTDHFEAHFKVPIKDDEKDLVQYLDIKNKDKAVKEKSYFFTCILDAIFPEMLEFWNTAFSILKDDVA